MSRIRANLLALAAVLPSAFFFQAPAKAGADTSLTPEQIVLEADRRRQPARNVELGVSLQSQDGGSSSTAEYQVRLGGTDRGLVLATAGKDKGQRVLMVDDGMWMKLPSSSRAIRITPLQRLLGQASYGDLGRMSWAHDYNAAFADTADPAAPSWHLRLTAKHPGATYTKLDVEVEKGSFRPLSARYYLPSGKLLKTATFGQPEAVGSSQAMVREVRYQDALNPRRTTLMRIDAVSPREFDQNIFDLIHFSER